MFSKNIIKTPLSFSVVFVLLIFSVTLTSFADDECPCFTAEDVMRFTPPKSPRTCFYVDEDEIEIYDLRISQRGEYLAAFLTVDEICGGCTDDLTCSAYVGIGDVFAPTVVLLGAEDGLPIQFTINPEQYDACWNLLYTDAEGIGECDSNPFEP